ncbi:spindle pole body component SPC98 [Striga asiatica]|uniref:Spindle pole body component SPC98 n=1 Tax=Striga asiatica TaxID=4170 RepID=A0A5A7QHM5_STRAF|nr:spindle pole body component SPC98 [Striga asiatica]
MSPMGARSSGRARSVGRVEHGRRITQNTSRINGISVHVMREGAGRRGWDLFTKLSCVRLRACALHCVRLGSGRVPVTSASGGDFRRLLVAAVGGKGWLDYLIFKDRPTFLLARGSKGLSSIGKVPAAHHITQSALLLLGNETDDCSIRASGGCYSDTGELLAKQRHTTAAGNVSTVAGIGSEDGSQTWRPAMRGCSMDNFAAACLQATPADRARAVAD